MIVGVDPSSQHIALAYRLAGRIRFAVLRLKGDSATARLEQLRPSLAEWLRQLQDETMGSLELVIEEPAIGKGARSTGIVYLFAGATYGVLAASGLQPRLVNNSRWKGDLQRRYEAEFGQHFVGPQGKKGLRNKDDVRDAVEALEPEYVTALRALPATYRQDIYDAIGILLSSERQD